MRAPDFWSGGRARARIIATALSPLGWVYGAVTGWKRRHAAPYRANAKVICIGNLTAGGAGKTPVAIAIANILRAQALNVAFLSRGYGGRTPDAALVDREIHTARDVGDEPLLLAEIAPVIVSRDRRKGAKLADARGFEVLVMDDGHQNFALAKDVSIVVVDAETGFGNGHLLPAGPLREPVSTGLARADMVVLVGAGSPGLQGYVGPVLRADIVPRNADEFAGRRVVAFAGIGRPAKFFAMLRRSGGELTGTIEFPDHHMYAASDMARLKAKAKSENAILVTTEKDFVRLAPPDREGIRALLIRAQFEEPETMKRLLETSRTRNPG